MHEPEYVQDELAAAKAAERELREQLTNHRTAAPSTPAAQSAVVRVLGFLFVFAIWQSHHHLMSCAHFERLEKPA